MNNVVEIPLNYPKSCIAILTTLSIPILMFARYLAIQKFLHTANLKNQIENLNTSVTRTHDIRATATINRDGSQPFDDFNLPPERHNDDGDVVDTTIKTGRLTFSSRQQNFEYIHEVLHNTILDARASLIRNENNPFSKFLQIYHLIDDLAANNRILHSSVSYTSTQIVEFDMDVRPELNSTSDVRYNNANIDSYLVRNTHIRRCYANFPNILGVLTDIIIPRYELITADRTIRTSSELVMNNSTIRTINPHSTEKDTYVSVKTAVQNSSSVNIIRSAIQQLQFLQSDSVELMMHLYRYQRAETRFQRLDFQ